MADISFTFVTRLDNKRIKLVENISGLKFNEAMRKILNDGNVFLVMSKLLERVIDDWVKKSEPKQVRQKPAFFLPVHLDQSVYPQNDLNTKTIYRAGERVYFRLKSCMMVS